MSGEALGKYDSVLKVAGVGEKTAGEFRQLDVETVEDLLFLRPKFYENRQNLRTLSSIETKGDVNTFVRILSKAVLPSNVLKVMVDDACDDAYPDGSRMKRAVLWCFGRSFLNRTLQIGGLYYLYGSGVRKAEFGNQLQISQFEIKAAHDDGDGRLRSKSFGGILPVYSSNALLNTKLKNAVSVAIEAFDWGSEDFGINADICSRYGLVPAQEAFRLHHNPVTEDDIELSRRTLSMMEIMRFRGDRDKVVPVSKKVPVGEVESRFIHSLPFDLTDAQMNAIGDILSDLESDGCQERILQGEVGSGKTIVAFVCCLHEISKGRQAVLMAPTEILSYQHYLTAKRFFENFDVRIAFLSSSLKKKEKTLLLEACKSGKVDLFIGTHSLVSDETEFSNLSFAVIDEEQRFGVRQKQKIHSKGNNVKILYMSATPIPASIMKIFSSQFSCSTLDTVPAGRHDVKTFLVSQDRRHEAYECIKSEFEKGHCAYFVVPRIEDDLSSELKSIKELEEELSSIFVSVPYACVNSKMKDEDRCEVLENFLAGKIRYLIATSVVEVGMDNKNATVIVVEDADMFGLATLHQLRGRVGRSSLPSWCFLVYRDEISESGKERLRTIKETADGFRIAERDLSIRGGGDIFGTRQSGEQSLKYFDFERDQDLL